MVTHTHKHTLLLQNSGLTTGREGFRRLPTVCPSLLWVQSFWLNLHLATGKPGLQLLGTMPGFSHGCWGSKPNSCTSMTSTLYTESSPKPRGPQQVLNVTPSRVSVSCMCQCPILTVLETGSLLPRPHGTAPLLSSHTLGVPPARAVLCTPRALRQHTDS